MGVEAEAERFRSALRVGWLTADALGSRLAPERLLWFPRPLSAPERLLVTLPEAMPGKPESGEEIYSGRFALAGQLVDANGASVFSAPAPTPPSSHHSSVSGVAARAGTSACAR